MVLQDRDSDVDVNEKGWLSGGIIKIGKDEVENLE